MLHTVGWTFLTEHNSSNMDLNMEKNFDLTRFGPEMTPNLYMMESYQFVTPVNFEVNARMSEPNLFREAQSNLTQLVYISLSTCNRSVTYCERS